MRSERWQSYAALNKKGAIGAPVIKRDRFLRCSFILLSDKKSLEYGKYAKNFFSLIRIK